MVGGDKNRPLKVIGVTDAEGFEEWLTLAMARAYAENERCHSSALDALADSPADGPVDAEDGSDGGIRAPLADGTFGMRSHGPDGGPPRRPEEQVADIVGEVDLQRPNAARMYDYYLGGTANFAVDQEAAEAGLRASPHARDYARANRAFLGRAVSYLAQAGIDQFLDLGSGIPTLGNVHEIAQRHNPAARVCYVDLEPVAVAHSRLLLADNELVSVTQADVRDPQAVLTAPAVTALIDFSRPLAIIAVAILPFVPDQREATELVATYRDACVPGSYLAVTHIAALAASAAEVVAAEEVMARTPTPVRWRGPEEIGQLLEGYELVPPGLVPTPTWRPDEAPRHTEIGKANAYAAVGKR
jgi:hypothetical protein